MNPTLRVRSGGSEKSCAQRRTPRPRSFLHPAPASDARSAPTEPSRLAPSFRRLGGANHCRLSHRQPHPGANYSAPSLRLGRSTPRLHANSGESHHAQHAAHGATPASPPLLPSDPSQVECPLSPKPLLPSPNAILWTLNSASSIGALVRQRHRPHVQPVRHHSLDNQVDETTGTCFDGGRT